MQIHELNNFGGDLNSGAYLAVDNGSDTGKVSAAQLTADVNNALEQAKETLNGRIDNIIAGGDAPSAAEITDARHGANGWNYSSLGEAIRGQDEDLADNIVFVNDLASEGKGMIPVVTGHYWSTGNGLWADSPTFACTKRFPVYPGAVISYDTTVITGTVYIVYWDENYTFVSSGTGSVNNTVPAGAYYAALDVQASLGLTSALITIKSSAPDPNQEQILNIYNAMDWDPLAATLIPGKLLTAQGALEDIASTAWLVSDEIDISSYPAIKIKASTGYNRSYYALYDENHNFLSSVVSPGGGATLYETILFLPDNAHYARFSKFDTNEAYIGVLGSTSAKKWLGKKWVCIGDSLTEVNGRATERYHDFVASATGITVVNMGESGTGYMSRQDLGHAFYQRAANVPLDADVYTIFGSGNDLSYVLGEPTDSGTTTICGCINETIDVLIGLIPTIQLGIVAPTPWAPYQPDLNDSNAMAKYVKALKEICYIRSIPFLDLYHESNLRPWTAEGRAACYSKDDGGGTHPDETGHKIIAPRFEGFLDSLLLD